MSRAAAATLTSLPALVLALWAAGAALQAHCVRLFDVDQAAGQHRSDLRERHGLARDVAKPLLSSSLLQLKVAGAAGGLETKKQQHIPRQLVLTGVPEDVEALEPSVRANLQRLRAQNPGFELRYLGDRSCGDYIKAHYDERLFKEYSLEKRGSFRGDICRLAVLIREGGFYLDLDVELTKPLDSFVDQDTTLVSAYESPGSRNVLNALVAATPQNVVLKEALEAVQRWEEGKERHEGWMGPVTLGMALHEVAGRQCPEADRSALQWSCGQEEAFRLYVQQSLNCFPRTPEAQQECPEHRASSSFDGLHYGLFVPGSAREVVGWPRFEDCGAFGCGSGGWSVAGGRDR